MTTLLYLEHCSWENLEADAQILETLQIEDKLALVLDQSPFYPEGGGQPADQGYIGDAQVKDVQTLEGKVLHFVDKMPSKATTYHCVVDSARRKDLSQQHSGQHLLSAVSFNALDAKTVGFHLSEHYTTIDLDKKLETAQIEQLELLCFEAISQSLSLSVLYPTEEELASLPLRKQPKVSEDIRVIQIKDMDYSPCGGTHVRQTSEIGGIKITKYENYKGGTRLEFVCGDRFLKYIQEQARILEVLSKNYSSPQDQLLLALEKRDVQMEALKRQSSELLENMLRGEVDKWLLEVSEDLDLGTFSPVIIRQFEDRPLDELKQLSQFFVEAQSEMGICLISKQANFSQFVFARPKTLDSLNFKVILQKAAETFKIKGGGAPHGVTGSLEDPSLTEDFILSIEQLIN